MELVLSLAKVKLWTWADSDFIESFNLDTTAAPDAGSASTDSDIKKKGFSLEPCDKKATLYVMNHTKLDNPAFNARLDELIEIMQNRVIKHVLIRFNMVDVLFLALVSYILVGSSYRI